MAYRETEYYDRNGKKVKTPEEAASKVECKPWSFDFYIKRHRTSLLSRIFGYYGSVYWKYHHRSNTFGSWMWPEGLPIVLDDEGNVVDRTFDCIDHSVKIGSGWIPGVGRRSNESPNISNVHQY